MDIHQIRRLEPKLAQFLDLFGDCFDRKDTRAAPGRLRPRATLRPAREERRADRPGGRRRPAHLAGVPQPPSLGTRTACGDRLQRLVAAEHQGPHTIGLYRRDRRSQEGGQDPRRAEAMVRPAGQDRELRRHRPPGSGPRRLPLPARRRAVPARELGRRPRPLPRGPHPRRP